MNYAKTQEQLRTLQDLQKERHERDLADIRWVLSKPAGRRVIWWILQTLCNSYAVEFTGSSKDIYANGKKAVGIAVHARIIEATKGFKMMDCMYREMLRDQEAEASLRQAILMREEQEKEEGTNGG